MTPDELKQRIRTVTVWKRGAQRAPHKPLLLLYALAKCMRGEPRMIPFTEVDRELRTLLLEFGPPRKSCHPEYPFWRLRNDGVWELENAEHAVRRSSNSDAKKTELLKHGVRGGFTIEVFDLLAARPRLVTELAAEILGQHFPPSLFDDILAAVGMESQFEPSLRRKRDPAFREKVLVAYEHRCAVCGYDVRLGSQQLALEAAHIKWHQAGGPDSEDNGLALCALHHKLFDRGAFALMPDYVIGVSQRAHGTAGFSEWLMVFHGRRIRMPQSSSYRPTLAFVDWHRREVFHGPARSIPL
ncbi:MAG: HNH endonuclease [Planctomycetia bacterium]|nr:HNH endonuclease [Planctomycetia bacterium]